MAIYSASISTSSWSVNSFYFRELSGSYPSLVFKSITVLDSTQAFIIFEMSSDRYFGVSNPSAGSFTYQRMNVFSTSFI